MLKKKLKSEDRIKKLLKKLNIKKYDNVLLHSNIGGLYQYENEITLQNCDLFLKIILKLIANKGTLLIPTYNYDFTKGGLVDRKTTKSEVGKLSNTLLKKYYKFRTFAPVFSHLVFGDLRDRIFKCDYKEVFGNQSIFSLIHKKNFKIICFCCSVSTITFLHFIEKKLNVKYRKNKFFEGYINSKKKLKIKYFAGIKKIDYRIKEKNLLKLIDGKKFKVENFGRFKVYSVNSKYLYDLIKKQIKKQNNYLINNG